MRALVVDRAAGPAAVRDLPEPAPPPGGVVVRVEATGLCRSDWHAWAGHDDDVAFPHVPGHELAGEIVAVGAGVERWTAGRRVTVPFVCGCGRCEWCRQGDAQVCPQQTQPGFTHWGSFAEQVVLHAADANLVALPDGLDAGAAAALGCRFATAYRGLVARARLRSGETLLVVGAGGVGLSAAMIGRAIGARVVVVDRHDRALAAARDLGADHVVRVGGTPEETAAAILETAEGGAHVAVDAVGHPDAAAAAILSLRRRGRHVQIGLLPPVDGHPRVPMARVIGWELDVLGSHGMAAADYPALLRLVADGALQPQRLVERTIGLAEAADLLPRFDAADLAGLTIIDPRLP
ncbi:alcohol dehydrogenase catalytic domain-containing protein [Nocardioides sp. TRM66260-LWL]|uniref:alcohol dehydrogenase catalytic domain-containing protein n=1 Tax=Nocardioides sp. TRM66260-LWL TaxID=2874478 RepID=UPI001CC66A65|nr:alcohol dehydrogenase catalytic domain-containing protein [Nocardioides sp. TRM66260-LWL]MBZ5733214.1 alcohol dehydrogenase catalytic domain-containing protein [Nocardioides sp. TRM66260-LWL]